MAIEFTTPVGRMVQGDLYELQTTDSTGQPLKNKDGTPAERAFFSLAINKDNPEWPAFYNSLYGEARQSHPQCFDPQTGQQVYRDFAWKVIDGDGRDQYGKAWSEREGFAGCWVVKFGGSFLPKVVHNGEIVSIKDYVKPGMFIRVIGSAKGNGAGNPKPGLYLNPAAVELIGYGKPIVGGIDAVKAFAAAPKPAYIPPGMSAQPVAAAPMPNVGLQPMATPPAGMGMPWAAMPGLAPVQQPPQQGFVAQTLGQQAPGPGLQPIQATPPAGMGMGPGGMPQPQPMPGLAPAAVLKPTPAAQGHSLEAWKATGRSEQDLIAAGIFTY